MNDEAEEILIRNYRDLVFRYGKAPQAVQYGDVEGQRFRFEKLVQIADLNYCSVLDVGCGLGDLYGFLTTRFKGIHYTGIDIVPEMISEATDKYPQGTFKRLNILRENMHRTFDCVLICGVFNNAVPNHTRMLREVVGRAFRLCNKYLAFNFISTYVNRVDGEMAYHDPREVFTFCVEELTPKVSLHHHYERCDVAVFLYK